MKTSEFSYDLPPDRIAQWPTRDRLAARMMVVHRDSGQLEHRTVRALSEYVRQGDLLVVNDSKVFPARVLGHRVDTGGKVEVLLLEETEPDRWEAYYRASRPARAGLELALGGGRISARILARKGEGRIVIALSAAGPVREELEAVGLTPLPPYIKRRVSDAGVGEAGLAGERVDRERYQTVYASEPGSVAAPTAGLHFTAKFLADLESRGVRRAGVTLHVGPGTFRPVRTGTVEEHQMDSERYTITEEASDAINEVMRMRGSARSGPRIVAVGTTTVRVLETAVRAGDGRLRACGSRSSLFILPPFEFQVVDALLTNFHLPMSTLIMLVSAFAGRALIRRAYETAVREQYRFYSYGDCMLIL